MNNLCSTNNAKYVVMYVPGQIEVSKPKDITYYPYFENLKDKIHTALLNRKGLRKIYVMKKG